MQVTVVFFVTTMYMLNIDLCLLSNMIHVFGYQHKLSSHRV